MPIHAIRTLEQWQYNVILAALFITGAVIALWAVINFNKFQPLLWQEQCYFVIQYLTAML